MDLVLVMQQEEAKKQIQQQQFADQLDGLSSLLIEMVNVCV